MSEAKTLETAEKSQVSAKKLAKRLASSFFRCTFAAVEKVARLIPTAKKIEG